MSAVLKTDFLDIEAIRKDFPILSQQVHGKKLVFLDSAASAQKPRAVIDAMVHSMETEYANVHRGLHFMSERTSDSYEAVRGKVAKLLNAASDQEIVFTRNATESINLVAYTYGRAILKPGDAIFISEITMASPGLREARPKVLATRLMDSVALRVKTISFSEGALISFATFSRTAS